MASEALSATVKGFIREYIHSVAQIEILALMHGTPEREWTAQAIDKVLRSNEQSVARRLAEFAQAGLIAVVGDPATMYRYQPRDATLEAAAAETVAAYRVRPIQVIETIFRPDDPAQTFADAFRIRPR